MTFDEWWLDNVNQLRLGAEEAEEDDGMYCARMAWKAATRQAEKIAEREINEAAREAADERTWRHIQGDDYGIY